MQLSKCKSNFDISSLPIIFSTSFQQCFSLAPKRTVLKLATAASRTRRVTTYPPHQKLACHRRPSQMKCSSARLPGRMCPPSSKSHALVSQRAGWCMNHPLIPCRHRLYTSNVNFLQEAFQGFFFLSQESSYCRSDCTLINMPVSL